MSADETLEKLRATFVAEVEASARALIGRRCSPPGSSCADLATQGWHPRARRARRHHAAGAFTDDRAARRPASVDRSWSSGMRSSENRPCSGSSIRWSGSGSTTGSSSPSTRSCETGASSRRACGRHAQHLNNGWADALSKLVDPYLQFVTSEDAACSFTGLRLMDVWRYFRHTWTNQYTSVPGRTMLFLVRDRAADHHPVMGIGALSSPIMQIRERDSWIGWHPDTFLERVRPEPTRELAHWLVDTVDTAIDEIYVADLLEDKVFSTRDLSTPSTRGPSSGCLRRVRSSAVCTTATRGRATTSGNALRTERRILGCASANAPVPQ